MAPLDSIKHKDTSSGSFPGKVWSIIFEGRITGFTSESSAIFQICSPSPHHQAMKRFTPITYFNYLLVRRLSSHPTSVTYDTLIQEMEDTL